VQRELSDTAHHLLSFWRGRYPTCAGRARRASGGRWPGRSSGCRPAQRTAGRSTRSPGRGRIVLPGGGVGRHLDDDVGRQALAVDPGLVGGQPLAHRQAVAARALELLPLLDGALAVRRLPTSSARPLPCSAPATISLALAVPPLTSTTSGIPGRSLRRRAAARWPAARCARPAPSRAGWSRRTRWRCGARRRRSHPDRRAGRGSAPRRPPGRPAREHVVKVLGSAGAEVLDLQVADRPSASTSLRTCSVWMTSRTIASSSGSPLRSSERLTVVPLGRE
jgi:hypothetical protein